MALSGYVRVERGAAPLIVSIPHAGTTIPDEFSDRFVSLDRARVDADWHLPRLYGFARELGATLISTDLSRSVIDMNRDPSGASLYPGQVTTGLCPTETFDGRALYCEGAAPDQDEIARRRERFHAPYHAALAEEVARLGALFPRVALYDAHSIASRLPRLFEGELPEINIGTNSGAACAPALPELAERLADKAGFSRVRDGRFKGGWITRHYGRPDRGVHAMQIELAWRSYAVEPQTGSDAPPLYDEAKAARLQTVLKPLLSGLADWAREGDRHEDR